MNTSNIDEYPLVEAIFEIRWALEDVEEEGFPKGKRDPHYVVLVGRLYAELESNYPHIERLSAENVPESMTPYVFRQQFRASEDGWPLVQVGPGIVTVNQTEDYSWKSFKSKVSQLTNALFRVYPQPDKLTISGLSLQYINAEYFDYSNEDLFRYLRENLQTTVKIEKHVFDCAQVGERPDNFVLFLRFPCEIPRGSLTARIGMGTKMGKPGIIWETVIRSGGEDLPEEKGEILAWAEDAHEVARKWFDAMTGRIQEVRYGYRTVGKLPEFASA